MSKTQVSVKEKLQKELDKYSTSTSSFKEYYASMKDISKWLQEREK